jgi:outer membrane protein insertion porin family
VRPGDRYAADAVRRGIRKLFALGVFEDVTVDRSERDGVVDLLVRVRERPRIARIGFSGNRRRDTAELEKKLFLRPGEAYAPTAVQTQIDSLRAFYREGGFSQARIEARLDTLPDRQLALRFEVAEGEKVRITRFRFPGATTFSEKRLRKQLKSKGKGFFGGGEPDEARFPEDREGIESWYRNHGYRDARVLSQTLEPGRGPRDLTLVVEVEEGARYRQGEVGWSGNRILSTAELEKMWRPRPDDLYDASRIEKASQSAYAEYAERGYLYLQVEPRETVRDSLVDVVFAVTEGQPSNVRMVRISGNRGTREKVIRREIDIREGDRFKRSALVRTQGDIFRLGLFEDVQIDFQPADSTDVDITLKVKEKQVGTASAGAGYTNESGLTGFLELGHNNVLGNGQSLSLHLERGARREDYYLSFTEPWFRDTPTLLGFSVFNTTRDRDLYEEKRVGGSGRIGRPLPWPDYARGSLTYRLEEVAIRDFDRAGLDSITALSLSGFATGEGVLTSSVELDFARNSTNNPFYPTSGTRFTVETELAGGPFGGSVNFHKHRIEGRAYLPSIVKTFTTMLRARVGFVGEYPDQDLEVPQYERFRLGGGTTIDPLRGYEDYQVVPDRYNRIVVTGYDTTRTATDTTVTARTSRLRYPGGRFMTLYTVEQQFPIVHPLHGVLFFDAGNTWDRVGEARPFDLKMGAGAGFRLEIPLLGNIGFDYGYGFDRDDGPKAKGHFLLGNVNF